MDEIELLKKKWLPKYWTSQNDIEVKEGKGSKIKVRPKIENFTILYLCDSMAGCKYRKDDSPSCFSFQSFRAL